MAQSGVQRTTAYRGSEKSKVGRNPGAEPDLVERQIQMWSMQGRNPWDQN